MSREADFDRYFITGDYIDSVFSVEHWPDSPERYCGPVSGLEWIGVTSLQTVLDRVSEHDQGCVR